MLCYACQDYFQHENDRAMVYLQLKTNILDSAKAEADDPALVQELEADLEQYQYAVQKHKDDISGAPCPWFRGDLSRVQWSPPESLEYTTAVWNIPCGGREVYSTALSGCDICRRLCAIVSHMPQFVHIFTVRFESWLRFHPISLKPSHIQFLVKRPFHHEWISFWLVEEGVNDIKFQHTSDIVTNEKGCLDFLIKSYETCVKEHTSCHRNNVDNWIPTRLLDVRENSRTVKAFNRPLLGHEFKQKIDSEAAGALVGRQAGCNSNEENDAGIIRLVERKDVREEHGDRQISYVTLSHVWGAEGFFTLTSDNLEYMKNGVELNCLPQSFQDAMPPLWALLDRGSYNRSDIGFDEWALSFDDTFRLESEESMPAFLLPLVQSPDASRMPNLTILGLILQETDLDQDQRTFTRIGFAIVEQESGSIANSGWFLKKWTQPPWMETDECKRTMTIK